MSHFVRIKTQLREQEYVAQALRELHYQFREGEKLTVRGYQNNRETAQIVVDTGSQNYDIGFKRNGEVFDIVADWWGVEKETPLRQETFIRQINSQYSYVTVRQYARQNDMIIEEDKLLENGDRLILLSERG